MPIIGKKNIPNGMHAQPTLQLRVPVLFYEKIKETLEKGRYETVADAALAWYNQTMATIATQQVELETVRKENEALKQEVEKWKTLLQKVK